MGTGPLNVRVLSPFLPNALTELGDGEPPVLKACAVLCSQKQVAWEAQVWDAETGRPVGVITLADLVR